jgi:putative FmdB family regulatory protein
MPLFDFVCEHCGKTREVFKHRADAEDPKCCGGVMTRQYTRGNTVIKMGPPGYTYRMDEIHKAQADRGERLRFVHPKEIGAS